jgi:hypothetical protein
MKRFDVLLIVLLLAGVGYGVFHLGRMVESESEDAAIMSSGGTQTTTASPRQATGPGDDEDDRRTLMVLVSLGVLAGIGLVASLSAVGTVKRSRRRDRWRLPR